MIGNTNNSFFARLRRTRFYRRINREIFRHLFPHLQRENHEGYSFNSYEEMDAETEAFATERLFAEVERQIEQLPRAYGRCFRHVMHRDLHERLKMYSEVASRRAEPETEAAEIVQLPA